MLIVPVVFHIIHNNGVENIPDAQVHAALAHMNEAYANLGAYDPLTGVSTGIQFCLAQRDPDGLATSGIDRVQSTLTEMTAPAENMALKDLSRWDPLKYMNIWVVKEVISQGKRI